MTCNGCPGVGPKSAQRIADERAKNPFARIEDLRRVSGIGAKTLEKLRPYVTVNPLKTNDETSSGGHATPLTMVLEPERGNGTATHAARV